jgi:hypothetical protein
MDGHRFDALAKTAAADGTRRAFLRGLVAAVALALPGQRALGAPPDGKGCKRDGINCKRDDQCCSGWCSPYSGECELAGKDIPVIGECVTNADCDDGDPCTYDVCGNLSGMCFHDPIPSCQACTGSGSCPHGGSCCDGRCCPEGSECRPDPQGTGKDTCCNPCGEGWCCDQYHDQGFAERNCLECDFCSTGLNCECRGDGIAECVAPGNAR